METAVDVQGNECGWVPKSESLSSKRLPLSKLIINFSLIATEHSSLFRTSVGYTSHISCLSILIWIAECIWLHCSITIVEFTMWSMFAALIVFGAAWFPLFPMHISFFCFFSLCSLTRILSYALLRIYILCVS